jgi:hypothetical protein
VAAARDGEAGADLGPVRLRAGNGAEVAQVVTADRHRLARLEPLHLGRAVCAAGDPEREQHDCRVHDVAPIAPAVAADERRERSRPARAVERPPRTGPAEELERDRGEHEGAERVRDQAGLARARAERDQADPYSEGEHGRPD